MREDVRRYVGAFGAGREGLFTSRRASAPSFSRPPVSPQNKKNHYPKQNPSWFSFFSTGTIEVDVKNYAKVEKIPGGTIEECRVLKGVLFNKDVVVPGRMRRRIENPRVLLLDCPLEYKKGESQTSVEMSKEEDW